MTVKHVFNGKKKIDQLTVDAIIEYTKFLDYEAPILTRVSYLLTGQKSQLLCIECNSTLQIKSSVTKASKFCSIACSKKSEHTKKKRKDTTLKKYGVSNIFQRIDIVQQGVLEKYGVKNVATLPDVRQKISNKNKSNAADRIKKARDTTLERYGVTHTSKLSEIKEKKANTFKDHYGEDHYFKTREFKDAMQQKFNGVNPATLESSKDKSKQTKNSKYGDPHFNNRRKATQTMIDKYGCHSSQMHWSSAARQLITNPDVLRKELHGKTINCVAAQFNVAPTTVRYKAYTAGITEYDKRTNQYEYLVEDCLISNNVEYIKNDRSILSGKELDFYIPSLKLAIECNGIFWHSELMGKDRKYHLDKTNKCIAMGIKLLHFWDYQFDANADLIISMIKVNLGIVDTKIGARQTVVQPITSAQFVQFMRDNHIQGAVNAKIRYGLFLDNVLVAAMGFGKSRFARNEYELLRFASLKNTLVVGGASKLMSYFLKHHDIPKIVTYAERDTSSGNMYKQLGFTFVKTTPPSYLYFMNRTVYNRLEFQKHKLVHKLRIFDPSATEWQNMVNNGFNRFWNTGDFKYEYSR